jgi:predicted HicB family RNase H-like nuclease
MRRLALSLAGLAMTNIMKYKKYVATVELDAEAGLFHGEIINLSDVVTFQGRSVDELRQAFRESVEDYLEACAEFGKEPEKPFTGRFVVRLRPEVHRSAVLAAKIENKSLNAWVAEKLEQAACDQHGYDQ